MADRDGKRTLRIGLLLVVAAGLLALIPVTGAMAVIHRSATAGPSTAPAAAPTPEPTVSPSVSPTMLPSTAASPAVTGPTAGSASIGALADAGIVWAHTCTAAVMASSTGDVIVTAAHCVSGTGVGMVFAPGYRDGTAPYGTWMVQAAYVDPGWLSGQNPHDDVAFLVVAPAPGNPSGKPVQQVVGGYPLGTAPAAQAAVQVTGYTDAAPNSVSCTSAVFLTFGYPSFDCAGFADGTSGGPWVAGAGSDARIVGVIGGLHQGGCSVSTSYTSPFGEATAATLARAERDAAPDTVPSAGGDGC